MTLPSGDYSIEGFEQKIAIERKSLEDLYGTLTRGRERFERELERLGEFEFSAVVIEAGWRQIIYSPPPATSVSPKSIYRSILAFQQRYRNTQWCAMDSRRLAEVTTYRMLERYWIDHVEKPAADARRAERKIQRSQQEGIGRARNEGKEVAR